jgi:hypothetical protein
VVEVEIKGKFRNKSDFLKELFKRRGEKKSSLPFSLPLYFSPFEIIRLGIK